MDKAVHALDRREAVARLLADRSPDLLVVTGLGSPAYDVMAAGDDDRNFYLWGAMGGAAMVGLGLARAQPGKSVLVVTGDAEAMMGLGALATIAVQKPANLTIAVLDNGHFGETGMQASHTGLGVELDKVAASLGFAWTDRVSDLAGVDALRAKIAALAGAGLAVLRIRAENPPRVLPPRDGVHLKNRFRAALGFATN
ncbi:MAG: aldehyde dehydrogenase [Methylobacteriaceae bacterium]|nr:aldehyde dehydrogenase [Rhodoblastus sp.]MCC0004194.1 aldehyde dehydrogenase [Methylobacteriaceae bacterium]